MMLKDTVPPTQRAEIVHDPADMVARRNARASFLVAVMVVLSVTMLLDVSFLDAPATPNDEANTLSVSKLTAWRALPISRSQRRSLCCGRWHSICPRWL